MSDRREGRNETLALKSSVLLLRLRICFVDLGPGGLCGSMLPCYLKLFTGDKGEVDLVAKLSKLNSNASSTSISADLSVQRSATEALSTWR